MEAFGSSARHATRWDDRTLKRRRDQEKYSGSIKKQWGSIYKVISIKKKPMRPTGLVLWSRGPLVAWSPGLVVPWSSGPLVCLGPSGPIYECMYMYIYIYIHTYIYVILLVYVIFTSYI